MQRWERRQQERQLDDRLQGLSSLSNQFSSFQVTPAGPCPCGRRYPCCLPRSKPHMGPVSALLSTTSHITAQVLASDAEVFCIPHPSTTQHFMVGWINTPERFIGPARRWVRQAGVAVRSRSCRSSGTTGWRAPLPPRRPGCSGPPRPSTPPPPRLRCGARRFIMVTRAWSAALKAVKALRRLRRLQAGASSVPQQHLACVHGGVCAPLGGTKTQMAVAGIPCFSPFSIDFISVKVALT